MKAQDLRIGNLIMDSPVNGDEIKKVESLYSNVVFCENDHHIYNDEMRGIPLTDELLLKFGFKQKLHGYWTEKLFIRICENGGFFFDWNGTIQSEGTEVQYVHQLQNLYFALTGDELELKPSASSDTALSQRSIH